MIREYYIINDSEGNLLMYTEPDEEPLWSEMPSDGEQFDSLEEAKETLKRVQNYNPKAHIQRITINIEDV